MSITLNWDITKIEQKYLKPGKYIDARLIANKQGRDDRGQDGMIAQTISKAIKEELGLDEKARGPIIGNYIDWDSQGQSSGNSWASKVQPAKAFQNRTPDPITDDSDDSVIPF